MMGWLDELPDDGMRFDHGTTVYRLRPKLVWNPISQTNVPGNWDDPLVLELPGAFIAQSSTSTLSDTNRTGALEQKSLYLTDPSADVQHGDRIRQGPPGSPVYPVDGIPAADMNPFTGWQPVREVPLQRAV